MILKYIEASNNMKYYCEICNYETHDYGNFSRHTKSKKHDKKMRLPEQKNSMRHHFKTGSKKSNDKEKSNMIKKYECKYCGNCFAYRQGLFKHIKDHCFVKKNENVTYDKLKLLEEKCKKLEETNEKLMSTNDKLAEAHTQNSKSFKKSINVFSYISHHFSDAPPIALLGEKEIDGLLKYNEDTYDCSNTSDDILIYSNDDSDFNSDFNDSDFEYYKKQPKKLEEIIIHYYDKQKLDQFLGDIIVNAYKKDNPKIQATWSSDVARLTFFINRQIGDKKNKENKWIIDKKGMTFTKLIIEPITERIKEILQKYVAKCDREIQKLSKPNAHLNDEIRENTIGNLELMQSAVEAIMFINLKKINSDVLKYVAPYFNLDVNNVTNEENEEVIESINIFNK